MKKIILVLIILNINIGYSATRYWVSTVSSNWSNPLNWSTTSSGAGGATIPAAGDFVRFTASKNGNCLLDANVAFDRLSISGYSGAIDLNGFNFNPTFSGVLNCTFQSGTIVDLTNTKSLNFTTTDYVNFTGTTFNLPVNITAQRIRFSGSVFNEAVSIISTGANSSVGTGGSTFNSTLVINNIDSGRFIMGLTNPDVFNDDLTIINSSTKNVSIGFGSIGNQINGNLNIENSGAGITFGEFSGTSFLANSKTVSLIGSGFNSGLLLFRNFTQLGNTAQMIHLTGTAILRFIDSEWNGGVDFVGPRFLLRGTTFNDYANLEKSGSIDDQSVGGNTFNGVTQIKVSGNDYFMPSTAVGNDYNENVTMIKTSSGPLYLGYNCTDTFAKNIYINSNSTIYFGYAAGGKSIFDGNIGQSINASVGTPRPRFKKIETNNLISNITLNTPILIHLELNLLFGNIITNTTNLITMSNNSTVSGASDDAYVDGPIEKIGNQSFIFPVGKSGVYRPIIISAPTNSTAAFRAEFFPNGVLIDGIPDSPLEPTINHISECEYWVLDRISTSNSVYVTLTYKNNYTAFCSGVTTPTDLIVARWNGVVWKDHGNGGNTISASYGTVISASPVTNFSPFTLADVSGANPLPIELVNFTAEYKLGLVELNWETLSESNNDYFTIERSANGKDFENLLNRKGAGNSASLLRYKDFDYKPLSGVSYYRLKQTDFDGSMSYSKTISVVNESNSIKLYPNPTKGVVTFENKYANINVKIYEMSGKLIHSVSNQESIDLSTFEKGIYLFEFSSQVGKIIDRIKVIKY